MYPSISTDFHVDLTTFDLQASTVKVTLVIVNYNSGADLAACLASVLRQDFDGMEIIIVDNASTDGSLESIQALTYIYPLTIIRSQANLGYAGGNNLGFEHARGEYVAVLNPDTLVDPGWLTELARALDEHPKAGLVTPKILLLDQPEKINTCGNVITMSGLTFCRGLEEPQDHYPDFERIPAVSGAAFLIKRSVLQEIGGFDERFFVYYEDTDLSLRAMLAGYELYYVPTAIVYHKYNFRYSATKSFYQERNRFLALMKTLHWRTLLAMSPSLLVAEIIAWGYALLHGPRHVQSKFNAYRWMIHNFSQIRSAHQQAQTLRRVPDRQLLNLFGSRLIFTQTTTPRLANALDKLVNPFMVLFASLTRNLVSW